MKRQKNPSNLKHNTPPKKPHKKKTKQKTKAIQGI